VDTASKLEKIESKIHVKPTTPNKEPEDEPTPELTEEEKPVEIQTEEQPPEEEEAEPKEKEESKEETKKKGFVKREPEVANPRAAGLESTPTAKRDVSFPKLNNE
jgi:hypothetical protein